MSLKACMPDTQSSLDPRFFRTALGRFATGVTVLTTAAPDGTPIGMTVSSFNSVSLDPPLILWSLALKSSSLIVFEQCERYVVNVLSAEQIGLARHFATGNARERFNGLSRHQAPNGTPMLDDRCAAWFECHNRSRYIEGDHIIMIGEVEHCGQTTEAPLVFHAGGFDLTPASKNAP